MDKKEDKQINQIKKDADDLFDLIKKFSNTGAVGAGDFMLAAATWNMDRIRPGQIPEGNTREINE